MVVLYMLAGVSLLGGVVLLFARDWVWSIDSRSDSHPRDEDGNPIRTDRWDNAHRLQGVVMVVVAAVLGILATVLQ